MTTMGPQLEKGVAAGEGLPTVIPEARHPLVWVAILLLSGVALGRWIEVVMVGPAVMAWGLWLLADGVGWKRVATGALAGAVLLAGASVWQLRQGRIERDHVVRYLAGVGEGEVPMTARVRVVVEPGEQRAIGEVELVARVEEVLTTAGWRSATGDVLVRWRVREDDARIAEGDRLELYGWLRTPRGPMNPGGFDAREELSAERVFAEIRVPRAAGIVVLERGAGRGHPLTRVREWLKGKMMASLVPQDVGAARALTALVLGVRDEGSQEIADAFATAGVAHLLAISGSHIVFFAAGVWWLARWIPVRPRWREVIVAGVVGLYVLATPCGPPVVRAAIGVGMVLLARLLGRPRQYLNILAAAAIVIVLVRPTDVFSAGFQLSFVATAGLVLMAGRVQEALFGRWLAREMLFAELAESHWKERRVRWMRWGTGLLVANGIGAVVSAPLVAQWFGQVNLWAVGAGIVALPLVVGGMIAGAVQFLVASVWMGGGELLAPLTGMVGKAMVTVVEWLAKVPGAAVPVRPWPWWVVAAWYGGMAVWVLRRRWGVPRAVVGMLIVGSAGLAGGWSHYAGMMNETRLVAFSIGQASSVAVEAPDGRLWAVDAGAGRGASAERVWRQFLQGVGRRDIDGILVTALDARHGGSAGALATRFGAREVVVSDDAWARRSETAAGGALEDAKVRVVEVREGAEVVGGVIMRVVAVGDGGEMAVVVESAGRRVLVADPVLGRSGELGRVERCDAVVWTGPRRGESDAGWVGAFERWGVPMVWTGRGSWARKEEGEWNTAEGAVEVRVGREGVRVGRAVP